MKVSADGRGVVSHAGMGLLRELADQTGLSAQVTAVLADTYKGPWVYALVRCSPIWPRRWPTGRTASTESASRVVTASMCSGPRLPRRRCGGWSMNGSTPRICPRFAPRELARAAAWTAGAAPPVVNRSTSMSTPRWSSTIPDNKRDAAPTWKKSFGPPPAAGVSGTAQASPGGEA